MTAPQQQYLFGSIVRGIDSGVIAEPPQLVPALQQIATQGSRRPVTNVAIRLQCVEQAYPDIPVDAAFQGDPKDLPIEVIVPMFEPLLSIGA